MYPIPKETSIGQSHNRLSSTNKKHKKVTQSRFRIFTIIIIIVMTT